MRRRLARSAVGAIGDRDWLIFYLHAGVAFEYLTKASLANHHPALMMEPQSFDSLKHACGVRSIPEEFVRTIGAKEALRRCGTLNGELKNIEDKLSQLLDARNGVAHLAAVPGSFPQDAVRTFLRATGLLMADLGQSAEEFWGPSADVVRVWSKESADEGELAAEHAIALAKSKFKELVESLPTAGAEAILQAFEAGYAQRPKYETDFVQCPACGRSALVSGSYDFDWEPDWDQEDGRAFVAGVYPVVRLHPGHLQCNVCKLELDGEDQLHAAGISGPWEIEDVDVLDFIDDDSEWELS